MKTIVFDCFCGHEHVRHFKRGRGNSPDTWVIHPCEVCARLHQIRVGSSQLYKDLRLLTRPDKEWVPSKNYDVQAVKIRVAKTHYYNVIALGNYLANKMLHKALSDYWNEVKGHWKFGSQPGWFSQQQ